MLVCNSCHRHYRPEDGCCPFCGTTLQTTSAPNFSDPAGSPQNLGMAAALVLGLALFACNKGSDEGETGDATDDATTGEGTATDSGDTTADTTDSGGADYGGPTDTTDSTTTTDDTGTADYGGPDTGTTDTGTTTDTSSDTGTADYGAAPPPDPEFDI